MINDQPTIWEKMKEQGYSRRDFIRFCSWIGATAGISTLSINKVIYALENKPRPPIVWFHFQECTCCSESFIRSSHPIVADILLDMVSIYYSETLMAASGTQAEEALQNTISR